MPILSRLSPALPQIPHILTRLRTLSTLHSSATNFQVALNELEKEQHKTHDALTVLDDAVRAVEKSLGENHDLVKSNVANLEGRLDNMSHRLEDLGRGQS